MRLATTATAGVRRLAVPGRGEAVPCSNATATVPCNAPMRPSVVGGLRSVEKTRLVIENLLGDVIVVTVRRQ